MFKRVRSLIIDSRRLFPYWSRSQRHSWVRAKLRLEGRVSYPIGVSKDVPAYLRTLPPGPPLALTVPLRERVLRLVTGGR